MYATEYIYVLTKGSAGEVHDISTLSSSPGLLADTSTREWQHFVCTCETRKDICKQRASPSACKGQHMSTKTSRKPLQVARRHCLLY